MAILIRKIKQHRAAPYVSPRVVLCVLECGDLSVNDFSVLVFIFVADTLFISRHSTKAHTNVRETAVVVEVLHGYLLR